MAANSYQRLHVELDGSFAPENIIDLRAEYAEMAVQLGQIAQARDCILALSITPNTPRFYLGEPQPLREILFTLVENSLADADVDIVNVRLGSVGCGVHGRHRLEIMVDSNGIPLPARQLSLFTEPPIPPADNGIQVRRQKRHKLSRIGILLNQLGGTLQINDVYGRGPQYIACFHLTCAMAANTHPNTSLAG